MTRPTNLEQRYRRLFAAYPREHREAREDEMVSTLLDVATPGQQRPTPREAAAILANGLTTRARSADECRLGLGLAGLVSLALATALGVAAAGVAALPTGPPPAGRVGIGRSPFPLWVAALVAVGLSALGLAVGLVRARFGVATVLVAVPVGFLTVGVRGYGGITEVLANVAPAGLALAGVAAWRSRSRPEPAIAR